MADTLPAEIVGDGGTYSIEDLDPGARDALKQFSAKEQAFLAEDADDDETDSQPDAVDEETAAAEESAEEEDDDEETKKPAPAEVDKKFSDALGELQKKANELDAKKRALADAEKAVSAHSERLKNYQDDPVGAVQKFIAEAMGTTDSAKIREGLGALYDELTLTILDLPVDSEKKQAAATSKLKREIEALRQEREAERQRLQEEQQEREHQSAVKNAVSVFDTKIESESDKYPYLQAGAKAQGHSPGGVVWGIVEGTFAKDGTEMSFEEAAEIANTHYKNLAEGFRPLFAPSEQSTAPAKTAKSKGKKKVKSLTNADASTASGKIPETGYIADDKLSLKRASRQIRKLIVDDLKESDDD
jgi:hypothetical protein